MTKKEELLAALSGGSKKTRKTYSLRIDQRVFDIAQAMAEKTPDRNVNDILCQLIEIGLDELKLN